MLHPFNISNLNIFILMLFRLLVYTQCKRMYDSSSELTTIFIFL